MAGWPARLGALALVCAAGLAHLACPAEADAPPRAPLPAYAPAAIGRTRQALDAPQYETLARQTFSPFRVELRSPPAKVWRGSERGAVNQPETPRFYSGIKRLQSPRTSLRILLCAWLH